MNYFIQSDIEEIVTRILPSLEKLCGKKVLITGAAGFLGRYFVAVLQKFNYQAENPISIVALDNHITSEHIKRNDQRRIDPNIEWIYGDASLAANLPDQFDYVLHAAGIASPEYYRANPLETIKVAVDVTRDILEMAKKNKSRVLFFSSSEIYGDPFPEFVPTNEDYRGNVSTRGPRACYDESKRMGETLCWVYQTYHQVHVSVARPFNVYGPGMMPKDYRVLPNFASSWAKQESLKVYGHGKQTRTFCYITDAIVGFFSILIDGVEPNVYNVGNPLPEISITDLAKMVRKTLDEDISIETIKYPSTYPEDEPNRRCPDISRITSTLNYQPQVSLEEGLQRFFGWVKAHYPTIINQ
jgi:UDP-glucuronate decarboxylase